VLKCLPLNQSSNKLTSSKSTQPLIVREIYQHQNKFAADVAPAALGTGRLSPSGASSLFYYVINGGTQKKDGRWRRKDIFNTLDSLSRRRYEILIRSLLPMEKYIKKSKAILFLLL